ncbi:MAG: HAMP domain-containing histidine kinase [Bacteroidia bacterium]|jgi:signal transduction histidine kinase|nr:HAMP domain-containing histidine kinase [Bacteroidia bacterium]
MIYTIKQRFTLIQLTFISITILLILLLYFFIQKKEKQYSHFKQTIESTYTIILKDVTVLRDFFENETINTTFFRTKKSSLLDLHQNLSVQITALINSLDSMQRINSYSMKLDLDSLKLSYTRYNVLINQIVSAILKRGYKDEALEGEMRLRAHKLEDYQKELNLINILQLRRHEKDFIIRQENEYIEKHQNLINKLQSEIRQNTLIERHRKSDIIQLLSDYQTLFNSLIEHDRRIGIKTSIGLKAAIDYQVDELGRILQSSIEKANTMQNQAQAELKLIFLLTLLFIVFVCTLATVYVSKKFTESIVDLKEKISEFVAGNFSKRNVLTIKNARYEVDSLANNFSLMEQHILNQMNALRSTNKELAILIGRASVDIQRPLILIRSIYDEAQELTSIEFDEKTKLQLDKSWNKVLTIIEQLSTVKDIKTEEILIEQIDLLALIKSKFYEHKDLPQFEQIVFSVTYSLKQEFYSSKELMGYIFYFLFENSIKYSKKRNGHSYLKVKVESQDKYMVKIVVSDNGIGIKKEDQAHIFEMFYRTVNKLEGTGLGLYIVQNSLQKINGTILLESDENKGTVFTLLIPNKHVLEITKIKANKEEKIKSESVNVILN